MMAQRETRGPLPPHAGGPPPPPGAEFFVHRVGEENPKTIGEWITQIGQALATQGRLNLDDQEISPADPSEYRIVYEQMPRGELSLKIELKWWPHATGRRSPSQVGPPKIGT